MTRIYIIIILAFFLFSSNTYSQNDKVSQCLKQIAAGKIELVKKAIPDLMAEYPDDPGVMLLHAVVIEDAFKAIEIYEKITNKYPESPWADDAYWRIVQFYAVMGDTTRAMKELESYRKKYPTSEFLIAATDVVRSSCVIGRSDKTININKHPELKKSSEQTDKDKKETTSKSIAKDLEDNSKATYGLQVGIYSTEEAAKAEMKRFHQQRLRTVIMTKVVDGTKMWAVVIGNYASKEAAEEAKKIVSEQCKCSPLIFKK